MLLMLLQQLQLSKKSPKELKPVLAGDRIKTKASLLPDIASLRKLYLERLPLTSPFRRAGLPAMIPDPGDDYDMHSPLTSKRQRYFVIILCCVLTRR